MCEIFCLLYAVLLHNSTYKPYAKNCITLQLDLSIHYKDSRHSFCYTFHVLKYIKVHKKLQLDFVKLRMGCSWYHMKAIYKNWYLILFTWIRSRTVLHKFVHYHKVLVACLETKQRWKIENKSSKITYHALGRHVQNHQPFFQTCSS